VVSEFASALTLETRKHRTASELRLCWKQGEGGSHFPSSQSVGRISLRVSVPKVNIAGTRRDIP